MSIRQYSFVTPIDEFSARITLLGGRNFNTDKTHDEEFDKVNLQVAEQDRSVLESVQPVLNPASNNEEVLVSADGIINLYRQRVNEWQKAGWRIDSRALAEHADGQAFAIPSPDRRTDKGWVIKQVPLL